MCLHFKFLMVFAELVDKLELFIFRVKLFVQMKSEYGK